MRVNNSFWAALNDQVSSIENSRDNLVGGERWVVDNKQR